MECIPRLKYFSTRNRFLVLNTTAATSDNTRWNDTAPTTSVFSVGTDDAVNGDASTYLAFVFADVQGYSKFGGYVGNGNADGTFVYTGFKPAFILIKGIDEARNWFIYDNTRPNSNVTNLYLLADLTQTEQTGSASGIDFVSNGFKMRNTF